MTKKQTYDTKRRTQVEDLPAAETKLSEEEMKKVKGGISIETLEIAHEGLKHGKTKQVKGVKWGGPDFDAFNPKETSVDK